MRNVLLVIKHEVQRTVGKPSFWIMAFLFPMILFVLTFGSQFMARNMAEDSEKDFIDQVMGVTAPGEVKPQGYVDLAGVVTTMPEGLPEGLLVAYPDEAAAQQAMDAGEIEQYYMLADDFLKTGEVILVQKSFSPFEQLDGGNVFEYVVTHSLTGDRDAAVLLQNPMPSVVLERLAPVEGDEAGAGRPPGQSLAPMAMLFIFFFVLTMSSGYMLTSVTKEKENRVVEVLLSSLDSRQLMLGKIIGLSAVALLQMVIWLGVSLVVLREGSPLISQVSTLVALTLPSGFLVWAILYFVLGYLMFASALGAIGALAPTAREGSRFTFAVLLPLMIPMWLSAAFVDAPNDALVVFLSIFPLTAPVSMVARMVAVEVPLWQSLLSLGLVAATSYALVMLSARFFRADTLLSGAPISLQRLREGLRRHSNSNV